MIVQNNTLINPISIKNQLKIIIYAGKDFTTNIKDTELNTSRIIQSHFCWIAVKLIKYQRFNYRTRNN